MWAALAELVVLAAVRVVLVVLAAWRAHAVLGPQVILLAVLVV